MDFEIVGPITNIEIIATGRGIRGIIRLRKQYGIGRWKKMKGIVQVRLSNGSMHTAEIHWYEAHGIGKKEFKLKLPLIMEKDKRKLYFVVCINNKGYEASLEVGKLYRAILDDEAASHGYIRVIDESGEDYGYSLNRFFPIEIPQALEEVLTSAL